MSRSLVLACVTALAASSTLHACREAFPAFPLIRMAWSSDGARLWTLDEVGNVLQIDTKTGSWSVVDLEKEPREFRAPPNPLFADGQDHARLGVAPGELTTDHVDSDADGVGFVTAFTGKFGFPRRFRDGEEIPWEAPSNVFRLAVSPSGNYVALADLFEGLQIFASDGAAPVLTLPTGDDPVTAIHWGRAGTRLATAQGRHVTLYDFRVETGFLGGSQPTLRPMASAQLEGKVRDLVVFGGDSRVLVLLAGEPAGILRPVGDELQDTGIRVGAPGVRLAVESPDASRVAIAGAGGSLRIFDLATGEIETMVLPGQPTRLPVTE